MGSNLSKRERFLVVLAIVAGLLFVYYQYFLTPLLAEVDAIKEEVREKEERLLSLRDTDNETVSLLSDIAELETKLNKLEVMVPANPRRPEVVTRLEASAKAAGVELLSIDFDMAAATGSGRGDNREERGYFEIPVQIYISGAYGNILDYLRELESAGRLYNVKGFDLFIDYSENKYILDMTLDLHAYALRQEGQTVPQPETYDFIGRDYGRDNPFASVID
ncbi:MAG: type 4a pilus biogenesis protein PilO [Bacillota bacterium]|nr:type 4a pilus biogenesis protein PilO [Bacillota bacterium]MDD3298625.1 type 4a pilus biogenesis protein PilO [Bacillota bacterium]MDD3850511.1 type 4a pilus biogenesis protein PilO [Bacillota bacterium]MDD4707641.1 type 4a pilus biogenesis protein PilO [Bacillota bacterium]